MAKNSRYRSAHNKLYVKKGARGCLFLYLCVALFLSPPLSAAQSTPSILPPTGEACTSPHYDETVTVRAVHDGDTLRLNNGHKIRLIGIDTPELARNNKPAEPFAFDARNRLAHQISRYRQSVKLVYDKAPRDHYRRTLAHVFLPDGLNLQADLLSRGLATAYTHPPNDLFSDCYHAAEIAARCQQTGIWSKASHRVRDSSHLTPISAGFHILRGRVQTVNESDKAIHLFIEGGVIAGIQARDKPYFDKNRLKSMIDRHVIVRGWLHPSKKPRQGNKFYMRLRHPSAINFTGVNDDTMTGPDC